MSCCKITSVCLSFAAKCWRCFTNALMTLRHYTFSRQHRTHFSEDVYAFVLWRYVAVQIWRVKELLVPGIVASTIKIVSLKIARWTMQTFESVWRATLKVHNGVNRGLLFISNAIWINVRSSFNFGLCAL